MKKNVTLISFLLLLLNLHSFCNDHVTLSIQNPSATATTLEYDVFIVNDGTSQLKLRGYQFGINFSNTILNSAVPAPSAYTYLAGTRDAVFAALNNNNASYNNFQLKNTSTNIPVAIGVVLPTGTQLKLGRFRFTNPVNWATTSSPNLTFQLLSQTGKLRCAAVVYTDQGDSSRNLIYAPDSTLNALTAANVANVLLNVPLPVTLSHFGGSQLGQIDRLEWITNKEENNSYFNLQYSKDGITFETIDKIYSQADGGTSNSLLYYSSTNDNPQVGHNYYRLEQVDIDGHTTIESVTIDLLRDPMNHLISLFPNPTSNNLFVEFVSERAANCLIKVSDLNGKMVVSQFFTSELGNNKSVIDLQNLADGMYLVQLFENNKLSASDKIRKSN